MLLKERRKGDCGNAINSEYFDNSGGSYTGRPSESIITIFVLYFITIIDK
jgi:hypothetical protein